MGHVLVLGLALASMMSFAQAQERFVVRMGVIANSAKSISQLGLNIAQKRGFLAHQGLELQLVPLPGVQHQVEALDKGLVDVSHTATPYLIENVLAGSDNVAIVGGLANPVFAILANPEIKSYAELRGKVIGLSLPADTITIGTEMLLHKAGLQKGDYKVQTLVGTPVRIACLEQKTCDAVPVGQPDDLTLMAKGYVNLGNSLEVIPHLQFNVIATRRSWAADNRDIVMRYVRAFGAAYAYMADPVQKADVIKLISETTDAPVEIAKKIYEFYFEPPRGIMPKQAAIDMQGLRAVVEMMSRVGVLKAPAPEASHFVDLQYLQAAGFQ